MLEQSTRTVSFAVSSIWVDIVLMLWRIVAPSEEAPTEQYTRIKYLGSGPLPQANEAFHLSLVDELDCSLV